MEYSPHIHHRRSIRLKGYDYAQAGAYFITICCQDRAHLFGEVTDGKMKLNPYGMIAHNEWLKTPEIRKNAELDVFVIMPNHIHGIIILNNIGRGESHSPDNKMPDKNDSPDNKMPDDKLPDNVDLNTGECNSPRQSPSNNIGAIVRGYKSSVTKQLNSLNIGRAVWQRNYYEHIIRNEQSFQAVSRYIVNNPSKWKEDKFY